MSTTGGDRDFLNGGQEIQELPTELGWCVVQYVSVCMTFLSVWMADGVFVTDTWVWVTNEDVYHMRKIKCEMKECNQSVPVVTWERQG